MKRGLLATLVISAFVLALGLAACGNGESEQADTTTDEADTRLANGISAYGYVGEDPIEAAVYQYMAEVVSQDYEKADASIPIVTILGVDDSNPDEVLVYGDFWVDNYNIEGDTLSCVSGGHYPGVMHLSKDGDGYVVNSFDVVADGADFDASARELFGERYDAFMEVCSDDVAREAKRKDTVSLYVSQNDLQVTQYQDYGWDPVPLQ